MKKPANSLFTNNPKMLYGTNNNYDKYLFVIA